METIGSFCSMPRPKRAQTLQVSILKMYGIVSGSGKQISRLPTGTRQGSKTPRFWENPLVVSNVSPSPPIFKFCGGVRRMELVRMKGWDLPLHPTFQFIHRAINIFSHFVFCSISAVIFHVLLSW